MILKAFTNAISEATLALESAKDKDRSAGSDSKASKLFKSQVESQLPQPSSIKQQLTTQINNPDDLKEIERRFKLIKKKCQGVKGIVGGKKDQVNQIKSETGKVFSSFINLAIAIKIATNYLPTIKGLITGGKTGLNVLPMSIPYVGSPVPGSGGKAIISLDDAIKAAESKIQEFDAIKETIPKVKDHIEKQTKPIDDTCDSALESLSNIENRIQATCDYADLTYLQVVSFYSNLLDSDDDETTIQFDNPEEILDNLEDSNKSKFFEFIENIETKETGYRIIKK